MTTRKSKKFLTLCCEINRECDFISLRTNKQNRQSINRIRQNILSVYKEFRDLAHKCKELSTENHKLTVENQNFYIEKNFSQKGIFKNDK